MHFDEEMGFQHLGPGITVLSPSDPRPPTVILEPFWFLLLGRELYQVTAFYHLLDDLAAQVGPEKMHVLAECR